MGERTVIVDSERYEQLLTLEGRVKALVALISTTGNVYIPEMLAMLGYKEESNKLVNDIREDFKERMREIRDEEDDF